jgi:hypothetical protein
MEVRDEGFLYDQICPKSVSQSQKIFPASMNNSIHFSFKFAPFMIVWLELINKYVIFY